METVHLIDNSFAFTAADSRGEHAASPVALILLNRPVGFTFLRAIWRAASYRVAADGAARLLLHTVPAAERGRYLPDAICGDFDSIGDEARSYFSAAGVAMLHELDQDTTDLEKCLALISRGPAAVADRRDIDGLGGRSLSVPTASLRVIVLGAFGGRLDHAVQNCAALMEWSPRFASMVLLDEHCSAVVLPAGRSEIRVAKPFEGPTVGLLPLGRPVASLTTHGLKWDVTDWPTEVGGGGRVSTSNHVVGWDVEAMPLVSVNTSGPLVWTCCVDAAAVGLA